MNALTGFLALLRAAQFSHHTSHWLAKGQTFEADHQLFSDLYTAIGPEFDSLAESVVFLYGDGAVDEQAQIRQMAGMLEKWSAIPDRIARAIEVERAIEDGVTFIVNGAENPGVALDNFLRQIADSHRKARYRLQRRSM